MARRNFKSQNNLLQLFLIVLSCILLVASILGIFVLFKDNENTTNNEYLVVSYYVKDDFYKKQFYQNGETINLPETDKYIWKFDDDTVVDSNYIVTDNVLLYSQPFTITFIVDGVELEENKILFGGDTLGELPIPTCEDYSFVGWYSADGVLFTSTSSMLLQDIILYAHWTSPLYNVICEYDAITSSYMVTGTEYDDATVLTIPSTYDDGVNGVGFVTGIKDFAFNSCTTLIKAILPNTITTIGASAFNKCDNLKDINLPNSLTSIGTRAFNQCSSLKSITIPTSLDMIGDYVFHYSGLEEIVIPNNIKTLGTYAFGFCKALTSVTFEGNSTCEIIGSGAFTECISLVTITLPSSVTKINSGAFYNCTSITTMTLQSITPPILVNTNAISSATTTIYIEGDLNVYVNATNWMNFASAFVEI